MSRADLAVKVSVEKKKEKEVQVKKSLGERVMAEIKHYYLDARYKICMLVSPCSLCAPYHVTM